MLIEFRVKNYRSFAGEMVLSLVAGRGKELPENTFTVKGLRNLRLVRCAAIYGANGSGKSSLILAFVAFRAMILASAESRPAGLSSLPVVPFKLDPHTPLQPSEFELSFLLG